MSLFETDVTPHPSAQSPFQVLTAVAVVLTAICALWAFVDTRMVVDAPVWAIPMKFAASFLVLFATISLVEARLSDRVRHGWTLRVVGWVMAAAFLSEMAYMMFQSARAEPSHFNVSTPFHRTMYEVVMALGAVALVVGVAVIGWLARRDNQAQLSDGVRAGIWLGFSLSFVLTMIVAGYLSVNQGHHIGVHPTGAPTLPFTGWSGVTGDLRPAHFLSLHAMQILPLLGLFLDRRQPDKAVITVRWGAIGYTILTLAVFGQALLGIPLLPISTI